MRGFKITVTTYDIQVRMPRAMARDMSHAGDCMPEVQKWYDRLREQLQDVPDDLLALCLKQYGAWSDGELTDHDMNLKRMLWIAACHTEESGRCDTMI